VAWLVTKAVPMASSAPPAVPANSGCDLQQNNQETDQSINFQSVSNSNAKIEGPVSSRLRRLPGRYLSSLSSSQLPVATSSLAAPSNRSRRNTSSPPRRASKQQPAHSAQASGSLDRIHSKRPYDHISPSAVTATLIAPTVPVGDKDKEVCYPLPSFTIQ